MKSITERWLLRSAGILVVLWLGFVGFVDWAMHQPPEVFGRVMMHMPIPAYSVSVRNDLDAGSLRPCEFGRLRSRLNRGEARNRGAGATGLALDVKSRRACLRELYLTAISAGGSRPQQVGRHYKDRVAFYAVYILEAHPTDVWQMQSNMRDHVLFASPKNEAERFNVAGACVRKLGIKFPALVDRFDNRLETAYTAWPDRLYLIARGGRVLYKSEPGPFGFDPDLLAAAIKSALP